MKLLVGNFKMNLLNDEIIDYIDNFDFNGSNIVLCPSSLYLKDFINKGFNVGIQNIGFEDKGAYTGDISASMAKSIGVKYAIVGHSERRQYYNDDIYVKRKLKQLLDNGITPILCIGENLEVRQSNGTNDFLKKELDDALTDLNGIENIIIAYEPIWSIGTGNIPSNDDIKDTIKYIKDFILENYKVDIKVLYGGSVNNDNISTLEEVDNIDGYLVGGCSINVEKFLNLEKMIK